MKHAPASQYGTTPTASDPAFECPHWLTADCDPDACATLANCRIWRERHADSGCDSTACHNQYPECPDSNDAINGNSIVGFDDINPLVALLAGGQTAKHDSGGRTVCSHAQKLYAPAEAPPGGVSGDDG